MKKIFYWFLFLCLSFTSCNDENKVVLLMNDSPELTVTAVSPQNGYVGTQVTIEGTDFGADASLVRVFFSGMEEAAEIVSCEDTKLVVKVPAGAIDGAITVKVREMMVKMDNLPFTVIPDPEIESVSPKNVYAGTEGHNEITVMGSNFGTSAEDVVLYLLQGEERIDAVVSACEDNKITATIPEAALFGEFDVKIEIKGREAIGSFKLVLNEKAVITDIATDHVFGTLFAATGTNLTIKGQNFGTNKDVISVKIGELDADVTSVSDTEIKVTIPEGFTSGSAITVAKDGITTTSDKTLNKLEPGMDVSAYALKNYIQPFVAADGAPTEDWTIPAAWIVNEAAKNKQNGETKVGGLQKNTIVMQAANGWDNPFVSITNGKIYQTIALPAGNYKLTVTLSEYFVNGGSLFFVVNKGDDLPDINNGALADSDNVCASMNGFSGNHKGGGIFSLEFALSSQSEVSIGFVATFSSGNNNFRATEFKLEYIGEATN